MHVFVWHDADIQWFFCSSVLKASVIFLTPQAFLFYSTASIHATSLQLQSHAQPPCSTPHCHRKDDVMPIPKGRASVLLRWMGPDVLSWFPQAESLWRWCCVTTWINSAFLSLISEQQGSWGCDTGNVPCVTHPDPSTERWSPSWTRSNRSGLRTLRAGGAEQAPRWAPLPAGSNLLPDETFPACIKALSFPSLTHRLRAIPTNSKPDQARYCGEMNRCPANGPARLHSWTSHGNPSPPVAQVQQHQAAPFQNPLWQCKASHELQKLS